MVKPPKSLVFLWMFSLVANATPKAASRPTGTISDPDFKWVDAPGIWSKAGGADGNGSGNGNGNGSGAGSGARGSRAGAGGRGGGGTDGNGGTEFTQPDGSGGKTANGQDDKGAQSGSSSTPGGGLKIHSLWWPICAFIDEDVSTSTANNSIKKLVEEANKCDVNVMVWTKTVKTASWGPGDPDTINKRQVEKCNIPPSLAAAGSTTSFVPFKDAAAIMCKSFVDDPKNPGGPQIPNLRVAGCAEMRKGAPPLPPRTKPGDPKKPNHTHPLGGGRIAASIEVPKGHNAMVLMHESQGHSMDGMPNGASLGNGIGQGGDEDEEEEDAAMTEGWTDKGCEIMQKRALPNDRNFAFDPTRQNYYVKPRDPAAYYDLAKDPPIFGNSKPATSPGNLALVSSPGQTIVFNDDAKPQKPTDEKTAAPKKGQNNVTVEDGEDTRHRRKVVNALLSSLKDDGTVDADPTLGAKPKPQAPPSSDPAKAGPRLGYDDNAAKGRVGGNEGSAVTSAEPKPEDVYSGASAPDGGGGSVQVSPGDSGGGSGKGSGIGFDESAPKGGLAMSGGNSGRSAAYGGADASQQGGALSRVVGSLNRNKSSLDEEDEFFDGVGEDGKPKRRTKKRASTLRQPQTELLEPSGAGRGLRSQKDPVGSL